MSNTRCIFRAHGDRGYTKLRNAFLQDARLSDETRGLVARLLSLPDTWEVTVKSIIASGRAGRDKVYRMLKEAEALGYVKPEERQRQSDGTLWRQVYLVSDDPAALIARAAEELHAMEDHPRTENAEMDAHPRTVNPDVASHDVVEIVAQQEICPRQENTDMDETTSGLSTSGKPAHSKKNIEDIYIPPIVPQAPQMDSIWLGEDGVPRVVNGKRQALEAILGGKCDLDDAIRAVAGRIDRNGDLFTSLAQEIAKHAAAIPARPKRQAIPDSYSQDFEHFWAIYPRREGKGAAYKAWKKLSMDQRRKAYRECKRQLADLTARTNQGGKNVCPHPSTWINQARFDDGDGLPSHASVVPDLKRPAGVPDFVWEAMQRRVAENRADVESQARASC